MTCSWMSPSVMELTDPKLGQGELGGPGSRAYLLLGVLTQTLSPRIVQERKKQREVQVEAATTEAGEEPGETSRAGSLKPTSGSVSKKSGASAEGGRTWAVMGWVACSGLWLIQEDARWPDGPVTHSSCVLVWADCRGGLPGQLPWGGFSVGCLSPGVSAVGVCDPGTCPAVLQWLMRDDGSRPCWGAGFLLNEHVTGTHVTTSRVDSAALEPSGVCAWTVARPWGLYCCPTSAISAQ